MKTLLSDTMLKVIEAAKRQDPDGFKHVYEGVPESDDDAAIIKLSWIEAAVDAHKVLNFEPSGRKRIASTLLIAAPISALTSIVTAPSCTGRMSGRRKKTNC